MSEPEKLAEVHELLARHGSLSAVFHRVNRVVPADQEVQSIPPHMLAGDALALMRKTGFSQLPVVQGREILGLFTYRAFALEVAGMADGARTDPMKLPVEEFLEHEAPTYARLEDEFRDLIQTLDEHDSIVVSGPTDLVAILTPMDVLRYLYSIARAFVLIEETELALRRLLEAAMYTDEIFRGCVAHALADKYVEDARPAYLEDMTFADYVALVRDGRNWQYFASVFGGTRDRARGRLEPLATLRNDIFHFRRELSAEDHARLTTGRDWLLRCVRNHEARLAGEGR